VRNPRLVIDPDRHPRSGQGLDPACAFAGGRLVSDQLDINTADLGADQRLDDPGAGCQAVGADQDLAPGVVDGADRKRCAIFLRGKANRDGCSRGYRRDWQDGRRRTERKR
jgi:hypothetical protein